MLWAKTSALPGSPPPKCIQRHTPRMKGAHTASYNRGQQLGSVAKRGEQKRLRTVLRVGHRIMLVPSAGWSQLALDTIINSFSASPTVTSGVSLRHHRRRRTIFDRKSVDNGSPEHNTAMKSDRTARFERYFAAG